MHVIIPARYGSTRLPGKPLLDVAGKALIERVYERACASGAHSVTIATDDERIAEAARAFGASVCMTAATHPSGTDRIGEAIRVLGLAPEDIVVNLQGDEPLMPPGLLRDVAARLDRDRSAVMATACHPISDMETLHNPNTAKVVCNADGYALYFSRAPIPWPRDRMSGDDAAPIRAARHIGVYAYRAGFVARFCAWGSSPLEIEEKLEQLRVLWHGERIAVHVTDDAPPNGVDTPEDLTRVRKYFEGR